MWHMTLNFTCKMVKWDLKLHFWPGDLDLQGWPLALTHVTFDLDPCDPWPQRLPVRWLNETRDNIVWPNDLDLWPMTLTLNVTYGVIHVNVLAKFYDPKSTGCWDMIFGLVTHRHTESDAYEPTVHTHRWAQKAYNLTPMVLHYALLYGFPEGTEVH